MKKFLETIRFEFGKFHLLDYHQARIDRTFTAFYPGQSPMQLEKILPEFQKSGKHKFRLEYDGQSHELERTPYQSKQISSIEIVESNIDYGFKFLDRAELQQLLDQSKADEVIIVQNGLVADSSYSNLVFFDGSDWWTPRQPLLTGVRRAKLLEEGTIKTCRITMDDFSKFENVSLINAMLDLEELIVPIEAFS